MKRSKLLCIALCVCLVVAAVAVLTGCEPKEELFEAPDPFDVHAKTGITSDSLYVKKVDNLPDDFIMGMDASSVISLEKAGVKFYDFDGKEADVFKVLADNGINTIRVRVWNNPTDSNGNGYGGGNCDINTAIEIGKRATANGMNLMVDFHYSDFWADPAKQAAPKAWKDLTLEEKTDALYKYTKQSLNALNEAGVRISMVQIGNETNGKMCGENIWANIAPLMGAGAKAVREMCPKALIVVHFANPEKVTNYEDYSKKLNYYEKEGVMEYDVFASSYYPYWHGTLENLVNVLNKVSDTYGKKVMVAETSYAFSGVDYDGGGNTIGNGSAVTKNYPYTLQGQTNCIRDVIAAVASMKKGIGVCYWEGTWITSGGSTRDENKPMWNEYGTGWASKYAAEYDKDVREYGEGGTQVDNQTFFNSQGRPLESLKLWSLVYGGNTEIPLKADALEDTTLICDLEEAVTLPTKINAVMINDTKQEVDVQWTTIYKLGTNESWPVSAEGLAKLNNGVPTKYDIVGLAGGMEAHCYVSMVEYNFMTNYSFEDSKAFENPPTGWEVISKTKPQKSVYENHVESDPLNSQTGDMHYHFWGKDEYSVEITLQQTITGLSAGKYKFQISISGSDGGEVEIYAFVKIGDTIIKSNPMSLLGYQNWSDGKIPEFDYDGTSTLIVGIYVKCQGVGAGAWGKIDDAMLNSVSSK